MEINLMNLSDEVSKLFQKLKTEIESFFDSWNRDLSKEKMKIVIHNNYLSLTENMPVEKYTVEFVTEFLYEDKKHADITWRFFGDERIELTIDFYYEDNSFTQKNLTQTFTNAQDLLSSLEKLKWAFRNRTFFGFSS